MSGPQVDREAARRLAHALRDQLWSTASADLLARLAERGGLSAGLNPPDEIQARQHVGGVDLRDRHLDTGPSAPRQPNHGPHDYESWTTGCEASSDGQNSAQLCGIRGGGGSRSAPRDRAEVRIVFGCRGRTIPSGRVEERRVADPSARMAGMMTREQREVVVHAVQVRLEEVRQTLEHSPSADTLRERELLETALAELEREGLRRPSDAEMRAISQYMAVKGEASAADISRHLEIEDAEIVSRGLYMLAGSGQVADTGRMVDGSDVWRYIAHR